MLKRIANLPFKVLGRAARMVQEREDARLRAQQAEPPEEPEDEVPANLPAFDVPPDWDPGPVKRGPDVVLGWQRQGRPFTFVDVRSRRSTPERIPGSLYLPYSSLSITLAELPPAGAPIVVYCEDGRESMEAVRFLRFRGIDDAVLLEGGLRAWKNAAGRTERIENPRPPRA